MPPKLCRLFIWVKFPFQTYNYKTLFRKNKYINRDVGGGAASNSGHIIFWSPCRPPTSEIPKCSKC